MCKLTHLGKNIVGENIKAVSLKESYTEWLLSKGVQCSVFKMAPK